MGIYDAAAKDVFARQTQCQNLGRLLLRIVEHVFSLLNSKYTPPSSENEWQTSSGVAIDKADLRLYFWQAAREARELVLKALVLIDFVDSSAYKRYGNSTIDLIGHILDGREALRKKGTEFAIIQWPPYGLCPPPQPQWPVEVAMDVLLGGGSYPRLPQMMEEAVKQVGEADPASILKISKAKRICSPFLSSLVSEKNIIRHRVENEVLGMWALSKCPKNLATLSFKDCKVVFTVPYEFSITLIFDFQRCQIINTMLIVGTPCGLEVPLLLNIGFQNILRQGIGLLEMRHKFTVEKMKRSLREHWRELLALRKKARQFATTPVTNDIIQSPFKPCGSVVVKSPKMEYCGDVVMKNETSEEAEGLIVTKNSDEKEANSIISTEVIKNVSNSPTTLTDDENHTKTLDPKTPEFLAKIQDTMMEDIIDVKKKCYSSPSQQEDSLEIVRSKIARLKTEILNECQALSDVLLFQNQRKTFDSHIGSSLTAGRCFEEIDVVSPPDYFYELFCVGRWISGEILLGILRDQVLRARSFPKSFPGGVYRYIETNAGNLASIAKAPEEKRDKHESAGSSSCIVRTSEIDDDYYSSNAGHVSRHGDATSSGASLTKIGLPLTTLQSTGLKTSSIGECPSHFRLLDVLFLSQFDFTCGNLLSPLLKFILSCSNLLPHYNDLLHMLCPPSLNTVVGGKAARSTSTNKRTGSRVSSPTLRPIVETIHIESELELLEYSSVIKKKDDNDDDYEQSSEKTDANLSLERTSEVTMRQQETHGAAAHRNALQLRGSGAILRFCFNSATGDWKTILWPLSPIVWLLQNANQIIQAKPPLTDIHHQFEKHLGHYDDFEQTITLGSLLKQILPFDFQAVINTLMKDPSFAYIQAFGAEKLELSNWTGHSSACLSTLLLTVLAEYLKSVNKAFNTQSIWLKVGNINSTTTSKPQNATVFSAHRSLTFSYYHKYTIIIHIQPFDGSPRIAFKITPSFELSSQTSVESWIRLPSTAKPIDSELIAAFASCPSGMTSLVKALPHFKFLAFIDLLRQSFKERGFVECCDITGEDLCILYDSSTKQNVQHTEPLETRCETLTESSTIFLQGKHWVHMNNSANSLHQTTETPMKRVTGSNVFSHTKILPPVETPELTRIMHKLMSMGDLNTGISSIVTFNVDEWPLKESGVVVRVLLAVTVRNSWDIYDSHVVVLRCSNNGTMTIVARLPIRHQVYILGSDGINLDSMGHFEDYWRIVEKALHDMNVQLTHVTAIASLSPAQFPLFIRSFGPSPVGYMKDENQSTGTTFSFHCSPIRALSWPAQAFFWKLAFCIRGKQLKEFFQNEPWIVEGRRIEIITNIKRLANDSGTSSTNSNLTDMTKEEEVTPISHEVLITVTAILSNEYGVRLPAFLPDVKKTSSTLRTVDAPYENRRDIVTSVIQIDDYTNEVNTNQSITSCVAFTNVKGVSLENAEMVEEQPYELPKPERNLINDDCNKPQWFACSGLQIQVAMPTAIDVSVKDEKSSMAGNNNNKIQGNEFFKGMKFSKSLSSAYTILMKRLKVLGFFIQSIREVHRLSLLRSDIHVTCALSENLVFSWTPWPFHGKHISALTQQTIKNDVPVYSSAPVTFILEAVTMVKTSKDLNSQPTPEAKKQRNDDNTDDTVQFSLWWGVLKIKSQPLYQIFSSDQGKLTEQLQKATSIWMVVRLVIASYELHASVSCLEQMRIAELNVFKGKPNVPTTKLNLPSTPWTRLLGGRLGSEDLRCCYRLSNMPPSSPTAPKVNSPAVPSIIEEIRLRFEVLWKPNPDREPLIGLGYTNDPCPLCIGVRAVAIASAVSGATGVVTRSLNDTFVRISEGLGCLFQKGITTTILGDRCSPSLLGLYVPEEISSATLDGFLSSTPPSVRHSLYYFPGHLLTSVLLPLLDTVTVWSNAISSAVSVSQRSVIGRSGVLYLSKQVGLNENSKEPHSSNNLVRKTTLGQLRWKTIIASAPNTQDASNIQASAGTASMPPPSSTQRDPGTTPNAILEHALELRVIPNIGNVFSNQGTSSIEYMQHPSEPRDPVYASTVSLGVCSSLLGSQTTCYTSSVSLLHWSLMQQTQKIISTVSSEAVWAWDQRFNVLLLPTRTFNLITEDENLPSSSISYPEFISQLCTAWKTAVNTSTKTLSPSSNFVYKKGGYKELEDAAQRLAECTYLELYPCSLVLPYELCFAKLNKSSAPASSTHDEDHVSVNRRWKRTRSGTSDPNCHDDVNQETAVTTKRHKSLTPLTNEPSEICCLNSSTATTSIHRSLSSPETLDTSNLPTSLSATDCKDVLNSTFLSSSSSHFPASVSSPNSSSSNIVLPSDVNKNHSVFSFGSVKPTSLSSNEFFHSLQYLLKYLKQRRWDAPLRPHTAQRADGKPIELSFSCILDFKSFPALTEWSIASKYFRLFGNQMAVTDFPFLIRLLQCCPASAVGDIAVLLDLALVTTDLHGAYINRVTQSIMSGEKSLEDPPSTPFVQLEFRKPPIQRQGQRPLLEVDVVVWRTLPFMNFFICSMLHRGSLLGLSEDKSHVENTDSIISEAQSTALQDSFTFSISIPLPTVDTHQVLINNTTDIVTLINQLPPGAAPPLSLILQRPLAKVLARLFSPKHTFSQLHTLLNNKGHESKLPINLVPSNQQTSSCPVPSSHHSLVSPPLQLQQMQQQMHQPVLKSTNIQQQTLLQHTHHASAPQPLQHFQQQQGMQGLHQPQAVQYSAVSQSLPLQSQQSQLQQQSQQQQQPVLHHQIISMHPHHQAPNPPQDLKLNVAQSQLQQTAHTSQHQEFQFKQLQQQPSSHAVQQQMLQLSQQQHIKQLHQQFQQLQQQNQRPQQQSQLYPNLSKADPQVLKQLQQLPSQFKQMPPSQLHQDHYPLQQAQPELQQNQTEQLKQLQLQQLRHLHQHPVPKNGLPDV